MKPAIKYKIKTLPIENAEQKEYIILGGNNEKYVLVFFQFLDKSKLTIQIRDSDYYPGLSKFSCPDIPGIFSFHQEFAFLLLKNIDLIFAKEYVDDKEILAIKTSDLEKYILPHMEEVE